MNPTHSEGAAYQPLFLRQKRIHKLPQSITALPAGTLIRVGTSVADNSRLLTVIGFSSVPELGQTVLPPANLGPVSRRNANGWDIVHRDQPKEEAVRQSEWCWDQYCGKDETERVCRIVDIPYLRYPRTFVPPPSIELTLSNDTAGQALVIARSFRSGLDDEMLKHTVNLFLEVFGECQLFYADLSAVVFPRTVKVNWTVLPRGRRPWPALIALLEPVLALAKPRNQVVVRARLEFLNRFEPSFVAKGNAGFAGYLVFGFPELQLFVLESIYTNNATYVLGDKWESLSQLTKAEILNENLHRYRFIHRAGWDDNLARVLRRPAPSKTAYAMAA